ncbi:MAG: hypothetical protein AAFX08_10225 [Pseudomonadota bacterium]
MHPVSPQFVDLIILIVVLEFALLSVVVIKASKSWMIAPIGAFLASGALLLWALRTALADPDSWIILAGLALSFPAHLAAVYLVARELRARADDGAHRP